MKPALLVFQGELPGTGLPGDLSTGPVLAGRLRQVVPPARAGPAQDGHADPGPTPLPVHRHPGDRQS